MKMKIKKITHNHILSWIYALVVAIPLVTILVRCCYITFNKNAYESYSGNETITNCEVNYKYQTNEVNTIDDLVVGNIYKFTLPTLNQTTILFDSSYVYAKRFSNSLEIDFTTFGDSYIRVQYNKDTDNMSLFVRRGENQLNGYVADELLYFVYLGNVNVNYVSSISISDFNIIDSVTTETTEATNLDNAFEYSINELTQNGNTGELNLVNWFGDLFLDMSNAKTQLYLGFINYYMNYVLMVSCVYLLFSVLMWFLTWARRLLSKGLGE